VSDHDASGPQEVLRRLEELAEERAGGPPHDEDEVTPVQPYAATKRYLCPGCEGWIAIGEGHLVVVPRFAPDLRRHWHRACWHQESRRRPR
jgi:hypothetical protein